MRKLAKAVGARTLLALAVVAVLLVGCGGGSPGSSSSTTAAAGAPADPGPTEADGSAGAGAGGRGQDSGVVPAGNPAGAGGASGQSSPGRSPSSGRHGLPVPIPKGEQEPGITPQQKREATVASMRLDSPSVPPSSGGPGPLSARYTCDGKGISPALHWQGVPEGTAELLVFAMNLHPVQEKLFFDWAVGGISPALEEIKAGQLPRGAAVGRNSFGKVGYELCPEGESETYIFALFAVPKKLSPSRGFDPLALRREVAEAAGNVGLLAVSYARG